MKHELTIDGKRLAMYPRLNKVRVEMSCIISKVLTKKKKQLQKEA